MRSKLYLNLNTIYLLSVKISADKWISRSSSNFSFLHLYISISKMYTYKTLMSSSTEKTWSIYFGRWDISKIIYHVKFMRNLSLGRHVRVTRVTHCLIISSKRLDTYTQDDTIFYAIKIGQRYLSRVKMKGDWYCHRKWKKAR